MSLVNAAVRRASRGGLDVPVAAFAAAAAGVAMFIVPIGMIEDVVLDSGLGSVFSPLTPPLGMKARAGVGLIAAAVIFFLVLKLMRALGGEPAARHDQDEQDEIAPAPRLRRRDKHPDAPARAPFSVTRDLSDAPAEPRIQPNQAVELAEPVAAAEPRRRRAPLTELLAAEAKADETEEQEEAHAQAAVPESVSRPQSEPLPEPAQAAFENLGELLAEQSPARSSETEVDLEPEPEVGAADQPRVRPAWLAPDSAVEGESISALVDRLERAMERKRRDVRVSAPAEAVPGENAPMDARLRSALEELKRFAPRAG